MIALGSGDPSRAICSTLIAQAFQSVRYPILPIIEQHPDDSPLCPGCVKEVMHIQHHSLFAPRDFDISPYFQVIKVGWITVLITKRCIGLMPQSNNAVLRVDEKGQLVCRCRII